MQIYPRVYGKHFKLSGGKSHIHVFNIHAYFLTIENAYFISSVKTTFTVSLFIGFVIKIKLCMNKVWLKKKTDWY